MFETDSDLFRPSFQRRNFRPILSDYFFQQRSQIIYISNLFGSYQITFAIVRYIKHLVSNFMFKDDEKNFDAKSFFFFLTAQNWTSIVVCTKNELNMFRIRSTDILSVKRAGYPDFSNMFILSRIS